MLLIKRLDLFFSYDLPVIIHPCFLPEEYIFLALHNLQILSIFVRSHAGNCTRLYVTIDNLVIFLWPPDCMSFLFDIWWTSAMLVWQFKLSRWITIINWYIDIWYIRLLDYLHIIFNGSQGIARLSRKKDDKEYDQPKLVICLCGLRTMMASGKGVRILMVDILDLKI